MGPEFASDQIKRLNTGKLNVGGTRAKSDVVIILCERVNHINFLLENKIFRVPHSLKMIP